MAGQLRNRGERRPQLIYHPRNQPPHGRQLLGSKKLRLHRALFQQSQPHPDLVAQVLRQRLFVGGEIADPVVLIQLQYPHNVALRQHGREEQRLGRRFAFLRGHRERAAGDVRYYQQRAVVETGHRAG